jgi:hypothetical protein
MEKLCRISLYKCESHLLVKEMIIMIPILLGAHMIFELISCILYKSGKNR